jgi:hypothetical protein
LTAIRVNSSDAERAAGPILGVFLFLTTMSVLPVGVFQPLFVSTCFGQIGLAAKSNFRNPRGAIYS